MLVWAGGFVDLGIGGWQVPVTWVLAFDGLMTIAGVLLATSIWKRLAARGREPNDAAKLMVGCAGIALAYLLIAAAATKPAVPILLWLGFYMVLDLAIGWLEAPTASLTSRSAPTEVNATMMAVFKLATAFAFFLLGYLGRFFEPAGPALYWALTAGLPGFGLLYLLLFRRQIAAMLDTSEQASPSPALGTVAA
jgi:POT family proton-dependent oligopeptide transporter